MKGNPKKFKWWKIFTIRKSDIAAGVVGIVIFLVFIPAFTYNTYAGSLDNTATLMNRNDTGFVLFDRNGTPFFAFGQGKAKTFVPLSQVPKVTQTALIASEDKTFYSNPGFSVLAIARSALQDLASRSLAYGGSTITQQLVKNSLLYSQKSFLRKYEEVTLAYETDRRFSKDQILEMYLNSVYFGEGAFGIEEAAQTYFNKPASQLDLAQSAMLVGLLPAPSRLSPLHGSLQAAKQRQRDVLQKMVQQGYITQAQANQAAAEPLKYGSPIPILNNEAIHFALMVRDELIKKYGEQTLAHSGFKIITTLDLNDQRYAEKVVQNQVKALQPDNVSNGAAVVMDPKTGEILALVGSRDWHYPGFGQVNVATSLRQPGSSFKPIYYSAALGEGLITPATILQDVPTTFPGGYKPHDYDYKFWGPITVRRALANSRNVPSVEVMNKLGVQNAINQAHLLGITTLQDTSRYGLSLALGAGDVKLLNMVDAYSVFAANGEKNPSTDILEIDDKYGNVVYHYQPQPENVLSPGVAFLISSILSDDQARAQEFGNTLTISRPAAVKTGTTENYRDAWTLGYTPSLVVGAWVGNNDGAPMDNIAGSLGAAPIWKNLMEHLLAGTPVETFNPPQGVQKYYCTSNTTVQSKDPKDPGKTVSKVISNQFQEYFLSGTVPSYCRSTQATPTSTPMPTPMLTPTPTLTSTPSPTSALISH